MLTLSAAGMATGFRSALSGAGMQFVVMSGGRAALLPGNTLRVIPRRAEVNREGLDRCHSSPRDI
jgi:hypothetical protein